MPETAGVSDHSAQSLAVEVENGRLLISVGIHTLHNHVLSRCTGDYAVVLPILKMTQPEFFADAMVPLIANSGLRQCPLVVAMLESAMVMFVEPLYMTHQMVCAHAAAEGGTVRLVSPTEN